LNATGTLNPKTGGQGYPKRTFAEFRRRKAAAHAAAAASPSYAKRIREEHMDYIQTGIDRVAAAKAKYPRSDLYMGNSIRAVRISTGADVWIHHHVFGEAFQSYNFQWDQGAFMPLHHQFNLLIENGDNDYGNGVIYSKEHDVLLANAKDGTLEVLDVYTGELIHSVPVGLHTIGGTNNYGFALSGDIAWTVSFNADYLGLPWGPLWVETFLDANGMPNITFLSAAEVASFSFQCFYTDKAMGDGGPRRRCIDANALTLVGTDIVKGEIVAVRPIGDPANVDASIAPFSAPVMTIGDLVCAPRTYDSKIGCYDQKTLELRFEYDGYQWLVDNGYNLHGRSFVIANGMPVAAGNMLYWAHGEAGFQGPSLGDAIHGYEVRDP
jgi:hypothetical protein